MLIEQNLSLALAVADYVFVIENGIIVHESPSRSFGRTWKSARATSDRLSELGLDATTAGL